MFQRLAIVIFMLGSVASPVVAADPPSPEVLVERMIAAVGGDAFSKIGVLKLEVTQEEIKRDGSTKDQNFIAYVDTSDLGNLRMEMYGDVFIARVGTDAWSTVGGELDERPQTPPMAYKTLNQSLFTLLLPYSLKMEGVWAKEVIETRWEDREAWALLLPFAKGFFVSPVLETTWRIVVDKETFAILAVDFMPPPEYREVETTGVRYGILNSNELAGAKIASRILAVGLSLEEEEVGTYRVTKIDSSIHSAWAPTLFINPMVLEAMEEGGAPLP